jgi:copper chaperone CopZ
MRCGGCVRSVERILGNTCGVKDFSVRVGSFEAVIDPQQVQGSDIVAVLERAGLGADFQEEAP